MYSINLNTTMLILLMVFLSNESFSRDSETILRIDSVSVNEDMHVVIGWTFESEYTEGHFVIHRRSDDIFDSITTVYNLSDSFFIDTTTDASQKPYSYYISARRLKEDDAYESFASSKAHQTIMLENLAFDVCAETINIVWSNYAVTTTVGQPQPRPEPFDSTMVLGGFDNGDYQILGYSSFENDSKTINAAISGHYCFRIRSFNSDNPNHSSSSNIKCITTTALDPPEFAYFRTASVVENSFLRLDLHVDSTVSNPAYVLHRSPNQTDDFYPVDTVNSGKTNVIYYDDGADFLRSAYNYFFEVLDSCQRPVKISDTVSSIFLYGESISETQNHLQWNHPEGFPNGVDYYHIFRKTLLNGNFTKIDQIPGKNNTYNDYLPSNDAGYILKDLVYKIKAVEAPENPFGFKDTIVSNHAEIIHDIEIFIPSAFKPESTIEQNRVFKPVIRNAIPKKYRLVIYNNWGQLVFQTDNPDESWNGTINGSNAPAETYLYNLSFETPDRKKHQKKGSVILIR